MLFMDDALIGENQWKEVESTDVEVWQVNSDGEPIAPKAVAPAKRVEGEQCRNCASMPGSHHADWCAGQPPRPTPSTWFNKEDEARRDAEARDPYSPG